MGKKIKTLLFFTLSLFLILSFSHQISGKISPGESDLDTKVKKFLADNKHDWYDMNVPFRDGQVLYDLIIKHKYTKALEIGTSTGHSGVWIAWALSKTGGKLITIEINDSRYNEALANFRKAGLSKYIDVRLADAHKLVPELKGPFDFVFCDADKNWYKNYFIAVIPKLVVGGCYTAHNIYTRSRYRMGGASRFLEYAKTLANFDTTVEKTRSSGISISYKRSDN